MALISNIMPKIECCAAIVYLLSEFSCYRELIFICENIILFLFRRENQKDPPIGNIHGFMVLRSLSNFFSAITSCVKNFPL